MSQYKVKVAEDSGRILGFLSRGKIVREENATWYHHPSGADQAARAYACKTFVGSSTKVLHYWMVNRKGVEVQIT